MITANKPLNELILKLLLELLNVLSPPNYISRCWDSELLSLTSPFVFSLCRATTAFYSDIPFFFPQAKKNTGNCVRLMFSADVVITSA